MKLHLTITKGIGDSANSATIPINAKSLRFSSAHAFLEGVNNISEECPHIVFRPFDNAFAAIEKLRFIGIPEENIISYDDYIVLEIPENSGITTSIAGMELEYKVNTFLTLVDLSKKQNGLSVVDVPDIYKESFLDYMKDKITWMDNGKILYNGKDCAFWLHNLYYGEGNFPLINPTMFSIEE